ncbi:MAG TPA: 4Fe-4S ferredoxin [Candidatus Hydrogenedentes bacterium]|nr:4Fe-4S ferredoxin [Candidatus Hydrogenedentota bacterium]HOS02724.1 4Fe-4S ferredoxin [Candidatus Hydrogenedentota bacterium]
MHTKRTIIEIDEILCNGCGKCVPACHEGAIEIVDGKARLVAEKFCDGLGACLGDCPTGALRIVERAAESFDEKAVEAHLRSASARREPESACPSARVQVFDRAEGPARRDAADIPSALSHWPIKIRLVPPDAPFLQNAHLAVTSDCVPFAYAAYHEEFLRGKVALVGCPKFDDPEAYTLRFADMFSQSSIRGVTVIVMQVPCCQGLPVIIRNAMAMAGVRIPADTIVVGLDGKVLARQVL